MGTDGYYIKTSQDEDVTFSYSVEMDVCNHFLVFLLTNFKPLTLRSFIL